MNYAILAYVVGLTVLWGYAASLWMTSRSIARRERRHGEGVH